MNHKNARCMMASLESLNPQGSLGNSMAFSPGPLEIIILLGIFFILFGAERLPKMSNALGRSKGEFHKGLTAVSYTHLTLPTICSV